MAPSTITAQPPQALINCSSLYYKLLLDNQNWYSACSKAAALGGYLLSIDSKQEQDFVANNIGIYFSEVMTGLSDLNVDGVYQKPDGSPLTYSNFLPGYPYPWGVDQATAYALLITRTYFNSWESDWKTNQWYSNEADSLYSTNRIDSSSGEYATGVYAEIPLTSSISFSTTPKEGAGEFTTSINLFAGNQSTGNLAEGAHVYWKITGIQQSDLASGYALTGDGYITNGKLEVKEALVQDNVQENETLNISVYSDSDYQNQIGTTVSSVIQDSINLDIGTTTTTASKTTTLASTISRLILTGTGNINGTGNALNNYLTGNDGNNVLDGGAGNDIMAGGKGNDTFIVDSVYDSIIENTNEGIDLVKSSVNWTLGANVENLTLTGTDNLSGIGNELDNVITGNRGDNILDGGEGGSDTIYGLAGNDTIKANFIGGGVATGYIDGGDGNDTINATIAGGGIATGSIYGGSGDDVINVGIFGGGRGTGYIYGESGDDIIFATIVGGGIGKGYIDGGSGNDTLIADLSSGGLAYVELDGGLGNDILKVSGDGKAVLRGGVGNDTYYVDSTGDTITDTSGTDTVVASISWTLGSTLENLTLAGTDALTGIGNTGKNTIIGNAGNNVLDGLGGTDILTGGSGADTFRFSTRPNFGSSTADHITDFKGSEGDGIEISAALLGLTMGPTVKLGLTLTTVSSASELTTALGSVSTFVYDSSNGNLYWNQNGTKSGFGTGGIFAVLDNHATLTSSNISLV